MLSFINRFSAAAMAALLLVAVGTTSVKAQAVPRPYPSSSSYVDPNPLIAPGMRLNQWAYNQSVINGVNSTIPPYLLGYNPYVRSYNFGPTYPLGYPYSTPYVVPYYVPYYVPYNYGFNPYLISP
jgi:hypothetical protein